MKSLDIVVYRLCNSNGKCNFVCEDFICSSADSEFGHIKAKMWPMWWNLSFVRIVCCVSGLKGQYNPSEWMDFLGFVSHSNATRKNLWKSTNSSQQLNWLRKSNFLFFTNKMANNYYANTVHLYNILLRMRENKVFRHIL